jgi:hypothetical protein
VDFVQIAAEVAETEQRRLQAAAEADSFKAAAARVAAEGFAERKARRKLVASKSTHIANFLQRASLEAAQPAAKAELLELYTRASRANLELWNELESPTVLSGIHEAAWAEAMATYARGQELTGMVIVIEGLPLETRNPWDEELPG